MDSGRKSSQIWGWLKTFFSTFLPLYVAKIFAHTTYITFGCVFICVKEVMVASTLFSAAKLNAINRSFRRPSVYLDPKTYRPKRQKYAELSRDDKSNTKNFFDAIFDVSQYRTKRTGVENSVQLVFQLALIFHRYYWQPVDELDVTDDAKMFGMRPYIFWQLKIAISITGAAASAFTTFRQTLMTEDMMSHIQNDVPLGPVLGNWANYFSYIFRYSFRGVALFTLTV